MMIFIPKFTGSDSEIYSTWFLNLRRFLPLIKTHHHFFAGGFGLAAEYKALFCFPFF
jgi:hypothetical protein